MNSYLLRRVQLARDASACVFKPRRCSKAIRPERLIRYTSADPAPISRRAGSGGGAAEGRERGKNSGEVDVAR